MFDKIIASSLLVMENSKDVMINYDNIDKLLEKKVPAGKYWGESNAFGFMDYPVQKIVNYLLFYQSICFSFWSENKWSIDVPDVGFIDGSFALMYVFVSNIDLFNNPKYLEKMSFEEFAKLFKGNNTLPLLEERYNIIKGIAKKVNSKMNSNFYEYIYDIHDDITLMDVIINNFPEFKDERVYGKDKVYFYKLASLLCSDIMHVRNIKENGKFDYSHIAGCADYKIPQIIRILDLVSYSSRLQKTIDSKTLIEEGNPWEVEIRASAIVVINYIKKKTGLCGMDINDFLWLSSQNISKKIGYHLTRTVNY